MSRGWHDQPYRHSLAARGMRSRAIYTADLPMKVAKERYFYRPDEMVKAVKDKELKNDFARWIATLGVRRIVKDLGYVWWSWWDKPNVLLAAYDYFDNYLILTYVGKKKDLIKLLEWMIRENPKDKESIRALDSLSVPGIDDKSLVMYATTNAENMPEGEYLLELWDDYTHSDPKRLVYDQGGVEGTEAMVLGQFASTRRRIDEGSDEVDRMIGDIQKGDGPDDLLIP